MESLLQLLKTLEASSTIENDNEFLSLEIPLVAEISRHAEELLITPTGDCNWDTIDTLREHGFTVFAVERDGFGWLIGGIQTQKGVITYG